MLVGETGAVIQKCTHCEKEHIHNVNCLNIHDGLEHRAYTCRNCNKVTYNNVPHVVTVIDKIKNWKP
jgi:transcription elongation factor Elf1